ncbi:MAG: MarR family transcriptional regulator, partial [Bacteroidales bacterium]|nr:MarR family transcriptional regulator [Bacteroidales bacterium]
MVKYFSENLSDKNSKIKQKIQDLCMNSGDFSIADFARELNCSVPTTTKIVGELIDDGWLEDLGKKGSASGRSPSIFGLYPEAGFFVGVDLERNHAKFMTMEFKGLSMSYVEDVEFSLRNTE